jgi:hypothetical protein
MYRLNIRRWNITHQLKSSIKRTGKVSLKNVKTLNLENLSISQRKNTLTELRKPFQEIGVAFFTRFMGLFCSEGNRNMNGSLVCAGFLPRESVRNAWVFLNCSLYNFSPEGA